MPSLTSLITSILTLLCISHPTNVESFQIPRQTPTKQVLSQPLRLSPANVAAYSILGHNLGGIAGTPFVISGTKEGGWYRKINLPKITPPDRIFAPVWTTLFTCMGLAVARVYNTTNQATKFPLLLWGMHYALNTIWAPIFFGMKRLRLGLFINFILITSLGTIIPMFYSIDAVSAYLLIPYFGWLTFATYINYAICKLNPTKQGYNNAKLQADIIDLQRKAAEFAGI